MKVSKIHVITPESSDRFNNAEYTIEGTLLCIEENRIKFYFPLCNITSFVVQEKEL